MYICIYIYVYIYVCVYIYGVNSTQGTTMESIGRVRVSAHIPLVLAMFSSLS